jgi:hypothetical protein
MMQARKKVNIKYDFDTLHDKTKQKKNLETSLEENRKSPRKRVNQKQTSPF